jgi:hypothetical protein
LCKWRNKTVYIQQYNNLTSSTSVVCDKFFWQPCALPFQLNLLNLISS